MYKLIVLTVLFGLLSARDCKGRHNSGREDSDDKLSGESSDEHSIQLPIKSKHSLEIVKMPSKQEEHSTNVDIPSGVMPVYMLFKTQSSPLYVKQQHKGTKGSYQKTDSEDEPHKLVHEVVKPVIQELKEVITPYRKVIQVIEKVNEERLTKVHKKDGKDSDDNDDDDNNGRKGDDRKDNDNDDNDNKYPKMDDLYKRYGLSW